MASSSATPKDPDPSIPPDLLFLAPFLESDRQLNSSSPSLASESQTAIHDVVPPLKSQFHPSFQINSSTLWSSRLGNSLHNLSLTASPTYSEDGIPTVQAPASIILGSTQIWKNHLVAHFHGSPPSPAKIFSDLNPIWGKNGRISVKKYSDTVCLILIPCEETRKWALDVGFWHSGNCSFSLSAWSPEVKFASQKLVSAPVWVIFRGVPESLWSFQGFSTIASGVGKPLYTDFTHLPPYSVGVVRIKVLVVLANKRPPSVRVKDQFGCSVLISADYPRLPPQCGRCKEFGHLELRCPEVPLYAARKELVNRIQESCSSPNIEASSYHSPPQSPNSKDNAYNSVSKEPATVSSPEESEDDGSSEAGWTVVVRRSKPPPPSSPVKELHNQLKPLTSSACISEERMIKDAQKVLRNRPPLQMVPYRPITMQTASFSSTNTRQSRRAIRQALYVAISNAPYDEDGQSNRSSPSIKSTPRDGLLRRSVSITPL